MKTFRTGTHRTVPPQQTLDKIQPHLAAMGITRLANVTGLDDIGIPVFTACRPNAKAISVSQGKGISVDAAKTSAAMEAIETYHAENIDLPTRFCSYHELIKSHSVVDLDLLPKMDVIAFEANARRLWIEATLLQSTQTTYVPYDLVHCDFTLPLPPGSGCFQLSTNGLASGNTREEAASHALCELIERDALTLYSLVPEPQKAKRKVDLSTITDPSLQQLLSQIEQAEVMVSVWDLTSDLGIPTFAATLINKNDSPNRLLYPMNGSGTHLDKQVAIMRAITEAVQTRLTLISGSRDDASLSMYKARQNSEHQRRVRDQLMNTPSYVDFNHIESWNHDTIEEDLALLVRKLEQHNLPCPMMIDLTKQEFDIPVVRVIAPGLEGIHDVPAYVYGQRARRFAEQQKAEQQKAEQQKAEQQQESAQ